MKQLPPRINAQQFARQQAEIDTVIDIETLPRLSAKILNHSGKVEVKLQFDKDLNDDVTIQCRVKTQVSLECQRCMEPMTLDIDTFSTLRPVLNEQQAKQLPEGIEPIELVAGEIDPLSLVEDEILLAIPIIPKHAEETCE